MSTPMSTGEVLLQLKSAIKSLADVQPLIASQELALLNILTEFNALSIQHEALKLAYAELELELKCVHESYDVSGIHG